MNRLRIIIIGLFTIIISLLLGSCTNSNNAKNTNEDNIEIYQLIIHRIYSIDNSFGKAIDIQYLYIVNTTDDNTGDPGITKQPNQKVFQEIMDGINAKLIDLPSECCLDKWL